MEKNMPTWGIVLIAAVIAAWVGGWVRPASAQNASVEATGQTTCYNSDGFVTSCAGTGQDGDIQAGVEFPAVRFQDNGNGTVTDNLTNLIWLQNANCFPGLVGVGLNWQAAMTAANGLASGSCGLSDVSEAGDWRLPNVKELQSLIDFGFFNPALSNALGTAQCTSTDCAFVNVPRLPSWTYYWSSTTVAGNPNRAWSVLLIDGDTDDVDKVGTVHVWPVRGGQ